MASSQVEIVSPQNFGCVLRDRNQGQNSVFGKNMKSLVKDHHHHQLLSRVSLGSASSDENSQNRIDSWIQNQQHKQNRNSNVRSPRVQRNRKDNNNCSDSSKQTKVSRREKSDNSKRNDNLGASSLVQIWEARTNRSNGGNSTRQAQSTVNSSRSNSGVSILESFSSGPSVNGFSESSADEREGSRNSNVDATENEPKNSGPTVEIESGVSSNGGSDSVSDSGESKWVRVADIIRRLSDEQKQATSGDNKSGRVNGLPIIRTPRPSFNYCSSCSSSVSDRMFVESSFRLVNCSPRLRGRQAFSDLLLQLERDRHRELDWLLECNAVSKFSQRGRLQSMLRLRSLQRCQAIQDRQRSNARTADVNRLETGSAVMRMRDKFRANIGNGAAATEQKRGPHSLREIDSKSAETQRLSVSTQSKEDGVSLESSVGRRMSPPKAEEEATLCKNQEVLNGETESKMSYLHTQETTETEASVAKSEKKDQAILGISSKERGGSQEESRESNETSHAQDSQDALKAMSPVCNNGEQDQCLDHQETEFLSGWEEEEEENQQSYYGETYYDWFNEISRPRSYWEDLRKYRYIEVMNTTGSRKEEICRLLQRRTVSDFLESDLREKIDKVMMSRVQAQPSRHVEERTIKWDRWELPEDEEEDSEKDESKGVDDDESSQSSSQVFSPSPGRSWSSQDQEISSTPLLPVKNHPSPEMEVVSDLRMQVEQLQREMLELRSYVKTCMDVNAHLQQSVQRGDNNPLKRKCCVCNETPVDSLLYRCGHMCTCLKCANELQWSSGKCPICRAQILDVVRVFVDQGN